MYGADNEISSEQVSLEDRKLFVGGLGWDTTEKQLSEYFCKFGDVENISVKTNPNTGRSRGFAFVVFANPDCVDKILNGADHIINGRKVDAKKAIARTGKIFVGGLKPEISDDDIRNFFNQFGKVMELEVPFDKTRNQRKGFCFITFEQEQVANELLKNPQKTIAGYTVDLRRAQPKPESGMPARGGGGGTRGTRGAYGGRGGGRGAGYWGGYGSQTYGGYGSGYGGYGYDNTYGGYGSSYGGSGGYGNGYDYSNGYGGGGGGGGGYGEYAYSDGQSSRGRSQQQSRHQPY